MHSPALSTPLRQDVSTLFSVPSESLKRVTRERKYAIEETNKCLEESKRASTSGGSAGTADLIEKLKALRQRFADTHDKEQACIRKLQVRVEYVTGNVLETERELKARRGDQASAASAGCQVTIGNGSGNGVGRVLGNGAGSPHGSSAPAMSRRNTPYVDVLVQEYVARQGYRNTLRTLQQPNPDILPLLIDTEQYEELNWLVESIEERHSCSEALAWCRKNAAKLKKMRSALVFQLHVQEFVRLLNGGEGDGGDGGVAGGGSHLLSNSVSEDVKRQAMAYARTYLSPYASTYPDEFQRAAGLLVLRDVLPEASSCTELFAWRRWHDISSLLRRDYFSIHGLSLTSPLETHLTCGIAALQVSSNDQSDGGGPHGRDPLPHHVPMNVDATPAPQTNRNNIMHGRVIQHNDDPLRHPAIKRLAATVPSSKRTVSKLVCPVTGIVMEGNNEPVALPNGYVYGSLAVYGGLLDYNGDAEDGGGHIGASAGQTTVATTLATTEPVGTGTGVSNNISNTHDDTSHASGTRTTRVRSTAPHRPTPSDRLAKQILCPCTGDAFSMDQVRKLFIV